MRLSYKSPLADRLAFERSFHAELSSKVIPRWFGFVSGSVLLGGLTAIAYPLFPKADRVIALFVFTSVFLWLWNLGYQRCYRRFLHRYLTKEGDSELSLVEVAEYRFSTESRGVRLSFPLESLTHVYERDDYVYLDFSNWGRARVPFRAFASAEVRAAFITLLKTPKEPNQTPAPTAPSGPASS